MQVDGKPYRTIWVNPDGRSVSIIDQTRLPHEFTTVVLNDVRAAAYAIKHMQVRGAPLIGVTAAYGLALALRDDPSDANLKMASATLTATRPTAVNLAWALATMQAHLLPLPAARRAEAAFVRAKELADEDVELCAAIGDHGLA